jgi:hypothetical protein
MREVQHLNPNIPTSADIRARMARRGFEVCDSAPAISAFHTLAPNLIAVTIASTETLGGVQAKTGASLFLRWQGDEPTGFIADFPFSRAGERALETGAFDGSAVDPDWVCEAGPQTRFGYVWCFGATNAAAGLAVVRAGKTVREQCFPQLGVYVRGATADGRRFCEPMGFFPTEPGSTLYYSEPFARARLQAAS